MTEAAEKGTRCGLSGSQEQATELEFARGLVATSDLDGADLSPRGLGPMYVETKCETVDIQPRYIQTTIRFGGSEGSAATSSQRSLQLVGRANFHTVETSSISASITPGVQQGTRRSRRNKQTGGEELGVPEELQAAKRKSGSSHLKRDRKGMKARKPTRRMVLAPPSGVGTGERWDSTSGLSSLKLRLDRRGRAALLHCLVHSVVVAVKVAASGLFLVSRRCHAFLSSDAFDEFPRMDVGASTPWLSTDFTGLRQAVAQAKSFEMSFEDGMLKCLDFLTLPGTPLLPAAVPTTSVSQSWLVDPEPKLEGDQLAAQASKLRATMAFCVAAAAPFVVLVFDGVSLQLTATIGQEQRVQVPLELTAANPSISPFILRFAPLTVPKKATQILFKHSRDQLTMTFCLRHSSYISHQIQLL